MLLIIFSKGEHRSKENCRLHGRRMTGSNLSQHIQALHPHFLDSGSNTIL